MVNGQAVVVVVLVDAVSTVSDVSECQATHQAMGRPHIAAAELETVAVPRKQRII